MNINCSKCLMNGFDKNELLYFKDRKSLISYLKYCFIFLKKSIFMNHTIYMNNKFDLLKIDDTYLVGWHFLLSKTICKSCFIQLINKKYLFSKLKTEISDYDKTKINKDTIIKRNNDLLTLKRKRRKKIASIKKIKKEININKINEENNKLKSIQISPIIIPLSNYDSPKKIEIKRRRLSFRNSSRKKIKKLIHNENVEYDKINNVIIINKKILDDKSVPKNPNHNINNKNKKGNKFKSVKYVNISQISSDILNIKNLNLNSTNKKENQENKNTIIINNINNNTLNTVNTLNTKDNINNNSEINMNKVGLIQINNNNINPSNNTKNINQIILPINLGLSKEKIIGDCYQFWFWLTKIIEFNEK